MATSPLMLPLSLDDLLTRGYFHDRVIPSLGSATLLRAVPDIRDYIAPIVADAVSHRFKLKIQRNRPVQHSVPKRKHLRRILTVPHPLPYAILCEQIEANWTQIQKLCVSPISISTPVPSNTRAVEALLQRNEEYLLRARRSVGSRFVLHTDLARYYPSIYTHSIPWAIHGKTAARNDSQNLLFGNRIDTCSREMQDKQTGGIPIGPDSSFITDPAIKY